MNGVRFDREARKEGCQATRLGGGARPLHPLGARAAAGAAHARPGADPPATGAGAGAAGAEEHRSAAEATFRQDAADARTLNAGPLRVLCLSDLGSLRLEAEGCCGQDQEDRRGGEAAAGVAGADDRADGSGMRRRVLTVWWASRTPHPAATRRPSPTAGEGKRMNEYPHFRTTWRRGYTRFPALYLGSSLLPIRYWSTARAA